MILQGDGNSAVKTGGLTAQVGTFSIRANAKAFSILSSGLYTDKILAVIREISCNAYDAHVANGNADQPFEVHLPNQFEPFFRVTDFGTGLSEEDIYGLYTTYFGSSKTDSNDFIGALGLGSKSPFSYTQTFTVTSRHGGMKKIYTAFLTEDAMPSIVKMGEEPYDGPTGIDVQLAVKSNDIYTFADRAKRVFVYFPVRPKFTGAQIEIETIEYSTRGTGWAIRKHGGGARAIQGVVSYPVPQTNDADADELLKLGVDMFFPIGELEVAASREALSMNKATSANLAARIKMVATEIGTQVTKTIEDAPSYWEAVRMYQELMQNGSIRYALKNIDIKWEGRKLQDYFDIKADDHPSLTLYCIERRRYGRSKTKDVGAGYVVPKEHILVRNDLTRGSKGVLTRWVRMFGEDNKKYYLVSPVPALGGIADIDAFFRDTLGGPTDIKLLSEMKAQLPKLTRASGTTKDTFQTFSGGRGWRDSWSEAEDDELEADTLYYIRTFKGQPGLRDNESCIEDHIDEPSKLHSLKNRMVRMGLMSQDDPIFSGSPKMLAAIAKMENDEKGRWMNVMDLAVEAVVVTAEEKAEIQSVHAVVFNEIRRPERTLEATLKCLGITTDNWHVPALAELVNAYQMHFQAEAITKKYEARLQLASLIGRSSVTGMTSKYPDLTNLKAVLNKHSILGQGFGSYSDWSVAKQAVHFIVMLHEAEQKI